MLRSQNTQNHEHKNIENMKKTHCFDFVVTTRVNLENRCRFMLRNLDVLPSSGVKLFYFYRVLD